MRRVTSKPAATVLLIILFLAALAVGARWQQKTVAKQEILALLNDSDRFRRLRGVQNIADGDTPSTISVLITALDGSDTQLRSSAAWTLSLIHRTEFPQVVHALASHLQNDPAEDVRVCCASGLMRIRTTEVRQAYMTALRDKNEQVVRLACRQLSSYQGKETSTAIFQVLSNPSWRARLEACKALITLKSADKSVVIALERLSHEPGAVKYDVEIENFEEQSRKIHLQYPQFPVSRTWGKIAVILAKARLVAAQQG